MKQAIYKETYGIGDWEPDASSRCVVHLADSMTWRMSTGEPPPAIAPTASEYEDADLPWFDYYSDTPSVEDAARIQGIKSVPTLGAEKGDRPLPKNERITVKKVIQLRDGLKPNQVRVACRQGGPLSPQTNSTVPLPLKPKIVWRKISGTTR